MNTSTAQSLQQGYLLFGSDMALSALGGWCNREQQPLIYAKRKGKNIHVEMDLIFCQREHRLSEQSLEKVSMLHDAVHQPKSSRGEGGTYSYINHIALEHVECMAQAYLAIYRQNQGIDTLAPAFPAPDPNNHYQARLAEAKHVHYLQTHRLGDSIFLRWRNFCMAHAWPYIRVHEARKGAATVKVELPTSLSWHPMLDTAISQMALQRRWMQGKDWMLSTHSTSHSGFEKELHIIRAMATPIANEFAQQLVNLFVSVGYFPPIDESWHQ